jgi:hypothetical protein
MDPSLHLSFDVIRHKAVPRFDCDLHPSFSLDESNERRTHARFCCFCRLPQANNAPAGLSRGAIRHVLFPYADTTNHLQHHKLPAYAKQTFNFDLFRFVFARSPPDTFLRIFSVPIQVLTRSFAPVHLHKLHPAQPSPVLETPSTSYSGSPPHVKVPPTQYHSTSTRHLAHLAAEHHD